jgi:hypothetical protein
MNSKWGNINMVEYMDTFSRCPYSKCGSVQNAMLRAFGEQLDFLFRSAARFSMGSSPLPGAVAIYDASSSLPCHEGVYAGRSFGFVNGIRSLAVRLSLNHFGGCCPRLEATIKLQ